MAACTVPGRRATTPAELEVYKRNHYAALPASIQGTASDEDMERRLSAGGILLLGDIHDDRGLHFLHARILQQLIQSGRKLVLHVEFIGKEDEHALAEFLLGSIDLEQLRRVVQKRWPGSWMEFPSFDWKFYRRLLMTAREQGIQVQAMEPIPRLVLGQRDRAISLEILQALEKSPDRLHIVLIGHTHLLGKDHLMSRLGELNKLALIPRGGPSMTHLVATFAGQHSAAWHAPYLVLDEELWLLNPLPLRALGTD